MTKRDRAIHNAMMAGYHMDSGRFTRVLVESRVNRRTLDNAWLKGVAAKTAGLKCSCYYCNHTPS